MLSMPPAMITLALPATSASCAMIIACMPLPHILLIVTASTCNGSPAPNAACRAGAWPNPPDNTHPITICSTACGDTPARTTAACTAAAPNSVAFKPESAP